MKLLTFFGIANYQPAIYAWQGKQFNASYAPVASCHFLQPDELIVFLTEEAENNDHYQHMLAALPDSTSTRSVRVPLGKDEDELWQIFQIVAETVSPGESVAFDISHGLRSFPLIGLLVAAYLRSGLNVQLEAVLYGAFDVRNSTPDGATPLFDLSPMLQLLAWSEAADRFNRTGDSRYLASLLKEKKKEMAQQGGKGKAMFNILSPVGDLISSLTVISNAAHLIRPIDTIEQAEKLDKRIIQARPIFQQYVKTAPFALLLDTIQSTYQPLAVALDDEENYSLQENLLRQRELISWYVAREHWVQAVTVAREWLISWSMYHLELYDLLDANDRERVTNAINTEAREFRQSKTDRRAFKPLFLGVLPDVTEVLDLWNLTAQVRNDIDHAGMRKDHNQPDSLINLIRTIEERLQALTLE